MKTLIKNGRIVTAVDDYHADILIEEGEVSVIGKTLEVEADKVIDASGKLVIPGGIDPHTHMELPFGGTSSSDDFFTGTRAAAFGGTTTIIDFAVQNKGESMLKGVDTWHQKAQGKAVIDYGFHLITTDFEDKNKAEMFKLIDEGITSFKLFMAYPGVFLSDDATIYRAMSAAGERGGLVCMHAENGIVINEIIKKFKAEGRLAPKYHALSRPTIAEAEGVHRAIALAEMAETPVYIVHLSCSDALNQVRQARDRGIPAFAETCPQYLFLSIDDYGDGWDGAKYVMTPPLREKHNHADLWKGLKMDDLQCIATDHCPFCMKDQKELGKDDFSLIPNGAPGVEYRMELIYNGGVVENRISLNRFVELTSTAAAKLFGMFPKKGTIAVGSDADIVIFDTEKEHTFTLENQHMNVDYCTYEGKKIKGKVETVLSRGRVVIENGECLVEKGSGEFIKRGECVKI
ncbi:MAG: dihydropyrimidinase [Pyrinomonadaceae bacterium]|nr:dihydropyrimidinase [Pyrinomonadaceae bacterium]